MSTVAHFVTGAIRGADSHSILQPDHPAFVVIRRLDADNQCAAAAQASIYHLLVPGEGFEPPTFGLQNRCTTTVLTRQKLDLDAFSIAGLFGGERLAEPVHSASGNPLLAASRRPPQMWRLRRNQVLSGEPDNR